MTEAGMKVEITNVEELASLAVVLTSPWTVAEALYPGENDGPQREYFVNSLKALKPRVLDAVIGIPHNENSKTP
jgi:hypothetical protein